MDDQTAELERLRAADAALGPLRERLRCEAHRADRQRPDVAVSGEDAAWAAGLFCGEGWCGTSSRGTYRSVLIAIQMLDERSLIRFGAIFGRRVKSHALHYDRSRLVFNVDAGGRNAEAILRAMWPYLEGTDKGDQVKAACEKAGVFGWVDGSATEPRPRRRGGNQWTGKHHTEESKAKIAEAARRRWAERRSHDG